MGKHDYGGRRVNPNDSVVHFGRRCTTCQSKLEEESSVPSAVENGTTRKGSVEPAISRLGAVSLAGRDLSWGKGQPPKNPQPSGARHGAATPSVTQNDFAKRIASGDLLPAMPKRIGSGLGSGGPRTRNDGPNCASATTRRIGKKSWRGHASGIALTENYSAKPRASTERSIQGASNGAASSAKEGS